MKSLLISNSNYKAVVIGVSSGGMNALKVLFSNISPLFFIPIITVQHIGPNSENSWISLLNDLSPLTIKEAEEKEPISTGHIYIAPANYHLLIEHDETFSLSIDEKVNFARPSIDVLFDSAAHVYGESLIGILLTGANADGAAGLKRIKDLGGYTLVENPKTAQTPYMPQSAIDKSPPNFIGNLNEISDHLLNLITNKF